jgi:hypothetical protein
MLGGYAARYRRMRRPHDDVPAAAVFLMENTLFMGTVLDVDGDVLVAGAQEPKRRTIIDSISFAVIGTGIMGKT